MSEQSPYEQLGVSEGASFDEIQEARNRLMEQCGDDRKQMDSIESAYDAVLMHRLRMRQEGKIKVPDRIRFAEEAPPPEPSRMAPSFQPNLPSLPDWMQSWVDRPSPGEVAVPGAILGGLGALVLLVPDPASWVQLALLGGVGTSVYFLQRKEQRLGRSILLSVGGLILGLTLGSLFYGFLGGILGSIGVDSGQFATVISMAVLWAVASFLR
jgi:hypothetical protein